MDFVAAPPLSLLDPATASGPTRGFTTIRRAPRAIGLRSSRRILRRQSLNAVTEAWRIGLNPSATAWKRLRASSIAASRNVATYRALKPHETPMTTASRNPSPPAARTASAKSFLAASAESSTDSAARNSAASPPAHTARKRGRGGAG